MAFHWSMHQLTEYFAAISASSDEETAIKVAVERAVEALDAEVGAARLDAQGQWRGAIGLATQLPASVLEPCCRGPPRSNCRNSARHTRAAPISAAR